jgi:hypothetical protein
MRRSDERAAAEMLRRTLDAVERGELTADTPAERRNVRRLEGILAGLETEMRVETRSADQRDDRDDGGDESRDDGDDE